MTTCCHFKVPQFTLGRLMAFLTAICVVLGWQVQQLHRKARAIATIESLGGSITYDYQAGNSVIPNTANWSFLKASFGEHYGSSPTQIELFSGPRMHPEKFTDDDAEQMTALSELTWVVLYDTRITDAALAHFKLLPKLQRLDLEGTAVTEAGVKALLEERPQLTISFGSDGNEQMLSGKQSIVRK